MRYVLVRVVVVVLFVATFAAALVVVMHALHTDALHVLDQWLEWWGRLLELSDLLWVLLAGGGAAKPREISSPCWGLQRRQM